MFLRRERAVLWLAVVAVLPWWATAAGGEASWEIALPARSYAGGETTIKVMFPEAIQRAPLTFGIPLGQVASPRHVVLLDEDGRPVPADFAPLGDWDKQPARWTLVSCVLDGSYAGDQRRFTLRWGEEAASIEQSVTFQTPLRMRVDGQTVEVVNTHYAMTLTPAGITSMNVRGKEVELRGWGPLLTAEGNVVLWPMKGEIRVLCDGATRKAVRFTTQASRELELHQEFSFHAGSPYVRCDVRFINRSTKDLPLEAIVPLQAELTNVTKTRLGFGGPAARDTLRFCIRQEAFGWTSDVEGGRGSPSGTEDNLGEWVCLRFGKDASLMLVFPHFQEMAAGDDDVASVYMFDGRMLSLRHYTPTSPTADVRLRGTMARTCTYWLVFDPPVGEEARVAQAVKAMPYVMYDRQHLTEMGVFPEQAVSRLFDKELTQAALYFKRAQVPRPEYVRCSRGADPGPDKSGEGFYEVDLHAGGMVFGEVFQYFTPKPTKSILERYRDEIGIAREHIITGGSCTYRNGDIVLALFQQYLRTGNRVLHGFARIHAQVFADVSVSHAPESAGLGHYYCDWYGNPYVYQRFEGLLLGALVTGDMWWFETAQAMADYCVRAWKDGQPQDGRLDGGLGGVQHRSPYIAKMLLKMYEVTGKKEYADTAVRLAKWIIPLQEPEGWWRDTPGATREYRNSPIFAGYTCTGLWPLYHATRNKALLGSLMKAVDYHVGMQEDVSGNNPGAFPNSYWYRVEEGSQSKTPIPEKIEITGNFATTSHWADVILQAYLVTGDQDYFYSANAAWAGVLYHQTPEGGIPLSSGHEGSVWGHVMVESLASFAAVAEEHKLPIVLGSRARAPISCFMGKGASYKDGVFTFELKYRHEDDVLVRVFFPAGAPVEVTVNGKAVRHRYDPKCRAVAFKVPASNEFRTARVVVREKK